VVEEEIESMYELGWTQLLKNLGSQLKNLHTGNSGFGNNLFETLGEFSCKLHVLEVNCLPKGATSN
jgi:hypothetical protein